MVVIKQMLIAMAMLAVMVAGLAAPAMAEEVQHPPNDPPPVEEDHWEEEASAPGGVKAGAIPKGRPTTTAQKNNASAAPSEPVSAPDEVGQTASNGTIYDVCA